MRWWSVTASATRSRSRSRWRSASTASRSPSRCARPATTRSWPLGFLYGEGLLDGPRAAGPTADLAANAVDVAGPLLRDPGARRFYTTSSCGVCGKGALEEVAVAAAPPPRGPRGDPRALLAALPDRLRQPAFARTGGLHATGLFDAAGELVLAREDVGRHNAMDKVSAARCSTGACRWPTTSCA